MKKRTIFLSALLIGLAILATFLIAQVVPQDKYFVFLTKWSFSPEGMSPRCAFVDKNGYLYVSGDRKVLKYGRDGVRVMKIENLPNNDTFTLNSATMFVAVDDSGNIYVLNMEDRNVHKFDADGKYVAKWGSAGSGDGQFNNPYGIAVDGSGNVYVGDRDNQRIQKFDPSGNFILKWGSGGSGDGQFSCVRELAFDTTRNELYVLEDCGNRRIQVFNTAGGFQSKVDLYPGGVGVLSPYGFCVGPDGYFYVADTNNGGINKIWKVPHPSVGGALTEALGHNPGNDDYHFSGIFDVVFDSAGNLIVVEHQWNYGGVRAMKYRPKGAPLIDILSPLSNASLSGTVTIQTSVSMPDAGFTFNKVEFYRDTTKLGEVTASPYNFSWNTTATTNGPYALWAVASNTLDTIAKARVDIIIANGDAFPTISLTNPTLGAKIRGTVTLTATAGDDHLPLAKVEFYVDDRKVGQDTLSPFTLDWNSTSVDDGEHEFRATATDSIGQSVSSTVMAAVNNLEEYGFQKKWSTDVPVSLAFNKAKTRLYVGGSSRIRVYDLSGSLVQQIDSPGSGESFDWDVYIAVDDAGNIFATGPSQNKIWILDPTGKLLKTWGGTGNANYLYNSLREIALDSAGNIYLVDAGNHRIIKFKSDFTFDRKWGTQGGSNGQFNWPFGLAFDASGYLYITDAGNNRVQVFKADGTFIKTWGSCCSGNGQFNNPNGIAFDAEGNVYITDWNNQRIDKFTADGTFITKWGSYGSGDAGFNGPQDVIIDSNLNVYVADRNNGRVVVFRSTWKPSIAITSPLDMATVTGTTTIQGTVASEVGINTVEVFVDGTKLGNATLSAPVISGFAALAAAGTSNFSYGWNTNTGAYIDGPHKIKIKATNGLLQTNETEITVIANNSGDAPPTISITSPAAGDFVRLSATIKATASDDHPPLQKVEFFVDGIKLSEDTSSPYEYLMDSTGLIDGDHVIKVMATDSIGQTKSASITITVANHEEFAFLKKWSTDAPHGLAFDKTENLYVGGAGRVRKFSPEGTLLLQIDNTENFTLDQETFVAVDSAGNIYATCPNQNYIVKFDKAGKYLKKWGTSGSNNNQFSYPLGIAIDNSDPNNNYIYISDQQNHRIVKYDTNGTFIRKWGAQGGNDGWFGNPRGITVDSAGNVYVADSNNCRIQKFDSNGTFLKKFGTGGGAGDTQLNQPQGVGLDADGNVYIADHNNHRIVKYDKDANFLAKWASYGTGDSNLRAPIDVKVDSQFYVYVSDRDNGRIIKFRSSWKPAIELTAPLPDTSVSGTTQIRANVSSDVGISKVEVYVGGTKIGDALAAQVAANVISNNFVLAAAAAYTLNWNTATGAHPDGPYELKIVATNLQGKTSEVKINVVVNNSSDAAPTVSITSPAAGDYVRLSATIKATASDDKGIKKVEFYADGIKLGEDLTTPYEYVWDASSAVDGEHEIKVKAYDTIEQTASAGLKIQVANHEGFTFLKKWTTENPCALAIDKSGNIFVAGGSRVRKYTPDGTLLLQIDGTSDYSFDWEMGVAVDSQGNIYATCPNSNYVAKFDPSGKFLKKWGTQGTANTQFDWPIGIAADSSDNIYVVDARNARIVKFDSSGTFIKTWGNQGGTDGSFNWPYGIAIDAANNIYVADQNNQRIQIFNTSGIFLKKIGGTWGSLDNQFRAPRGVGYDSEGNIYVADSDNHRVVKYDASGSYLTKWGSQGNQDTNFNWPYDVKVDSSFYVYVADRNNNRILKFRSAWKPQIGLVVPVANSAVSGTTQIQANVASDIGIAKVEVYINGTKLGDASAASAAANAISGDFIIAAASSYTYNWNTTTGAYPDGAYKLKLIAYNAQNKTSEVEITVIVNNSSDALPAVSITSPAAGDIIRLSATIKAAATDDKGVAKVEFYADGTKLGEDASSPFEYTWDAKTVTDGEHEIKVTAYDTIGQTKSATVKVTTQSHEEFGFVKKWTTDNPTSLVLDPIGNIFVGGGNRVRKYSPEGVLLLQVENTSDFVFDWEMGVAVDGSGNIYATSPSQNYVVKLDSTGKFVRKWGTQGTGNNQFDSPCGIAVDGANNVYVVDRVNQRVVKFNADGTFLAKWGSQGGGDGSFNWPWGIAVDSANNFYVADQGNHRVQKFNSSGAFLMKFGTGWGSGDTNLRDPRGVGFDAEGNVYIADHSNHRIVKYDPTGIFLAKWGIQGTGDLQLQWPTDVKVDALYNVYVADRNNNRIIKFQSTWRPGITLTSPLANATVTGTVTVQASVASDAGISKVEVYVDGTKIGEAAAAQAASFLIQGDFMAAAASTYSFSWDTRALPSNNHQDGPHTLKLKAYNLQNKITETQITVIVNNSGDALPTVSIANPKEGDILRRTVRIQVDATDNNPVAKVEFYIDGTKVAEDPNSPFELYWDSQSVDDGDRIIKAAAVDSIGQRKEVSINVVVRNRDVYDYAYHWSTQWNNSYGGGNPNSIVVNNKRNSVYATFHERIEVYSMAGTFLFAITKPTKDEFPLTNEMRIAVDANGNIYATCPDIQTVVKFDAAGKFVKKWGKKGGGDGEFSRPQGIACDSLGNVYVCDGYYNADKSNNGRVEKFTADGAFISKFGTLGWNDGLFQNPTDIALDGSDNIYVTDNWNNRLNAFKSDGTFLWRKGDWGYGDQQFQDPRGIGISPDNYLFIADSGNNRIVKYDSAGTFKCKWGTSGVGDMNFNWPSDVAVSAGGYIFVADTNNQRIVVFKLRGLPTVGITNPLKDASVSGTIKIKGAVECEYGLSKIEWYIDGVKQGQMVPAAPVAGEGRMAAATTTPYEFNWNTASGFLNGSHDVKVLAYNSDNVANSSEVTVIVNNGGDTPPTVAITNLTEGQVLKDTVTIKASASDNAGVTKVEFFVDEVPLGSDTSSPYEFSWATKLSSDGKKKVKAVATDTIGQKSWATVNVIVDNAGRFLSVAVSDADVIFLTQDNRLKKVDKAGNTGFVIPSTIRVSQFQFDPLGYLYLVFQQKQELADGKPYILVKIDPKTNQVKGIDPSLNRLMWIDWSTSNNLQFDSAGNVYYFGENQEQVGDTQITKRVLRKYVNDNYIEDIINENIEIYHWQVTAEGLIVVNGKTISNSETWTRRINPGSPADKVLNIAEPDWWWNWGWMALFPDNRIYTHLNGSFLRLDGVYKLSSDLHRMTQEEANAPYIGSKPGSVYNYNALTAGHKEEYCKGLVESQWVKYLVNYRLDSANNLYGLVGQRQSKYRTVLKLYPTVQIIEPTLIDRANMMEISLDQLIIAGFNNAQGKYKLLIYDLTTKNEIDVMFQNIEIYHLGVLSGGSIIFDGLNLGSNQVVIGMFERAQGAPLGAQTQAADYTYKELAVVGGETDKPLNFGVIKKGGGSGSATLSVSATRLDYTAVTGGAKTSDQTFRIANTGSGTMTWTVAANQTWLTATPASGTGSGVITVSANPAGMAAGTYTGTITVSSPEASNSPKTIAVNLVVKGTGTTLPPVGVLSTPAEGTLNITGAVPVTGWAVDDVEVTAVKIYRDPVAGEAGFIYIGDATFVEGARPDIEALYPGYPMNNRAGWGYMMLTNFLPRGGNGPYKLYAFAHDREGNQTLLGSVNIGCNNGAATKPFGTIETPAQGGVASGNAFVNWGWVLTPLPNTVPKDGSTITVFVDSQSLGPLTQYDIYRADVATNFPGLNNTNGPFGIKVLDMTKYPDGVHSIFWIATDNAANADGIGSRFFTVLNTGSAPVENAVIGHREERNDVAITPALETILNLPMTFEPMRLKTGFDLKAEPEALAPDNYGVYHITIPELNRMEIDLGRELEALGGAAGISQFAGYALVGDKVRPLPIGSTLEPMAGTFSWIPGPGFVGNYDLVFVEKNAYGPTRSIKVKVTIKPKF